MATYNNILVVGATGYLGQHIIKTLLDTNQRFTALARNKGKLLSIGVSDDHIIEAQVTEPQQLVGVCEDVDVVISCLGITRQQDGLSYMDVDYQANLNVLLEAERAGVTRFVYVSAFKAKSYPQVRLLAAKEKFAARLLSSTKLSPCVIRPNGFFVDLEEFYRMATQGKVYQFGDGTMKMNPIDGEDLAKFCLAKIDSDEEEFDVGGPEVLTLNQIAHLAFESQGKLVSIRSVPDVFRRILLGCIKKIPEKWAGPAEFFLTMLGSDAIAPCYGERKLGEHFSALHQQQLDKSD
ncbi:SDR family oxidoreductase [Vibrio amylolyticus]|uniref:SDR family oxidoreductase n=1 Tax=Vibrio amylolyticus TaxID=2847292 RepID=UPI00354C0818